ncbi:MAG: GtrA family protein [Rubrobacteraceae bacterium]
MTSKRELLRRGSVRFSKFSVVGITNAVIDIGTLNLLLWLAPTREAWLLALYNAFALVLANLNSYVGNSFWTFRGRAEHNRRQTSLFILQALANILVSNGLFYLLVRTLLVYDVVPGWIAGNVAKVISIVVASVMSFFLMRFLVFSKR